MGCISKVCIIQCILEYWNKNIFRFVNIFKSRSVDNIQRAVKTVKSQTSPDLSCDQAMLMYGDDVLSRVKAVERILHIESSEQINETLTNEELQTAGEIFVYLIMCSDTMKPWIIFYKELFQTQSPDQIILTLNRLMKGVKTAQTEHFARIAESLFKSMEMKMFPAAKNTAGTFCLFEYRALFCVIWSFFGKKWPKSDVMIHRTLHLLDI